jgi:hypothetical protein
MRMSFLLDAVAGHEQVNNEDPASNSFLLLRSSGVASFIGFLLGSAEPI